ncbi:hypothetical protein GO491_10565 [Flavobacteriaceae bacterium Ap0902]|nr:hypothetical protein [Flavobacteriaceae bacterium Ap0902]
MKKILIIILVTLLNIQPMAGCAWYDPDYEYFNLFTQSIIQDKSFTPFLMSKSSSFYEEKGVEVPDDNIQAWKAYFNNKLTFEETKKLVYYISLEELNHLKFQRSLDNPILKKLGYNFYTDYKDAVDYLIEAKYLEPYMRIQHIENPDSFYYSERDYKQATDLDYDKIHNDLISLYHATKSKEIKLRYGYQIVRFNHYYRNYKEAINAFDKYVKPLNLKTTPYYMALDQMAGAQRGLGLLKEANWNFFQVFKHSTSRKASAFSSLKLTDEFTFETFLNQAQSDEDRIMAHFLLAYQNFNNPLPKMKDIYQIDPSADVLKVLEARAINELERLILADVHYIDHSTAVDTQDNATKNQTTKANETTKEEKLSWWDKVVNFFKGLFGSDENEPEEKEVQPLAAKKINEEEERLLNNPKRLPLLENEVVYYNANEQEVGVQKHIADLEDFTNELRNVDKDVFWDISYAYLKFLQKDYAQSQVILNQIFTNNADYNKQIQQMKMLNDIVSEPKIDAAFEEHIMQKYANFFIEEHKEGDVYYYDKPSTRDFLQDILANRYYLQGEYAKSFLMSNELTNLTWDPDFELTQDLEKFYLKENKSSFEKEILAKKLDVEDPSSFFNLIYGDYYARNGAFKKAFLHYKEVFNGNGFLIYEYDQWDPESMEYHTKPFPKDKYNFFNNVSPYIFGHNTWVSYESPEEVSMEKETFAHEFDFIHDKMNKVELMQTLLDLERIAQGNDERAAKANQLIGNVMYNTSKLGYYRHIFVFDINNMNGGKFHFYANDNVDENNLFYYKYFYTSSYIDSHNFEVARNYYEKALKQSKDKEQQARILFQLASIEQANYYQWEVEQPEIPYTEDDWYEKKQEQEKDFLQVKRSRYKSNFNKLKQQYADTQVAQELMQSCSYFDYFMQN